MISKSSFFLIVLLTVSAISTAQTSTVYSGNWSDPNNWSNGIPEPNKNATIQHDMVISNNITVSNGSYIVMDNGSITDPAGGGRYRIQVANAGFLDVNGNVDIEGDFQTGVITVREYDTLIVNNAEFRASSNITIEKFGVLIVNGDLAINAAFFQATTINCDGIIYVNGDINANSGFFGSVNISGTGMVQATGNVSGGGFPAPSFFGSTNIACSNNCEYGGGAGLPIELLSFDASHTEDGKVKLEWITETELNNDYFIIEKSFDGFIFEKVAQIPGAGTSLNKQYYETTTASDPKDVYFRLSQVDFDGSSRTFSHIALEAPAIFDQSESLIYPNPVPQNGILKVYLRDFELDSYLEIRDLSGKLIFKKNLNRNLNEIHLDEQFKNGLYILSIINSEKTISKKLIVGN